MRAAFYEKYGPPEVIQFGPWPEPRFSAKAVLVSVKASALNPLDYRLRQGDLRWIPIVRLPRLLGSDFSGVVTKIGNQVTNFQVGDHVYGMGDQLRYGTTADYIAVHRNHLAKMPHSLSFEEAASLPLAALTSLQALRDLGKAKSSMKIMINGASGGVGVFAVQMAKAIGMHVIGVCSGKNRELVLSLGANEIIDYTKESLFSTQHRFDIFFDVIANQNPRSTRPLLTKNGTYITTVPTAKFFATLPANFAQKQKRKAILVRSRKSDLDDISRMISSNQIKPIIHKVYQQEELQEAYRLLESKRTRGKIVISWKNSTS